MNQNTYSIDMGTSNLKIYCMADDQIINIKNTIALVKKNQIYAYGDDAYEMYEKTPDHIQICFPIENGIISHFNNMQAMICEVLEAKCPGKVKGADFIVAVPTDITPVERKAFFDMFFKSKLHPKNVLLVVNPWLCQWLKEHNNLRDWERELACSLTLEEDASLHLENFMILDNCD